jgi:hypothetical protein
MFYTNFLSHAYCRLNLVHVSHVYKVLVQSTTTYFLATQVKMSCYFCPKTIKCPCDRELEQGISFRELTCMTTDDYPQLYTLPSERGARTIHVCSDSCKSKAVEQMRSYYTKAFGGKVRFTSV